MGCKMATVQLLILCLFAFNYANCLSEEYERIDNPENDISNLKQFVLDSFNDNKESVYVYNHGHILDAQKRDGPERSYFMLLDIDVSCKKDGECDTKNLICEVIVKEDLTSGKKDISEDDSVCVKKLAPSVSLVNNGGFVEESVSEEVQRVAELAVEQLENEGDSKRTIFEIMSVKTQDNSDGKKLFLTLKVAKPIDDAVDMTEFETCEIEVSMKDPLTVENTTSCFPVSEGQTDYSMSEDDMNEEAKKAVNEINKLSSSPFQHVLVKVITADRSVTPGSQGSVTTIQFQVAPSLCLKNGGGARESPAVRSCPPASSLELQTPLQCTLTAWERPWHPLVQTLYSGPVCNHEKKEVSEDVASKTISELSEDQEEANEPKSKKKTEYCTGCPVHLDAESDSVRSLAQEVLTSMETAFAHRLVKVVSAQKQIVNGVKYIMTLEVVRTACPPEAARIDLNGCPEIDGEGDGGVRTCHIEVVERPWADSAREVIVNDCSGEAPATRSESKNVQASPDSTSVPQEEDSELNEVVQAFDEMFGDDPRVSNPEVELFDDSEALQEESNDVPLIALLHRDRRDTRGLVGGLRDVTVSKRDEVLKYAQFAVQRMDDIDDDSNQRVLDEVVSAHEQVVNGLMYHINFKMSTTECVEGQTQIPCRSSGQSKKQYLCKVQVHKSRTPGDSLRLVKSECSPIQQQTSSRRNRRSLVGAKFNTSVDEPYIQELSHFAVDHISSTSGGEYKKALVEVIEAQKQVVSGLKVDLKLKITDSSCSKTSNAVGDCPAQDDRPFQICRISIWDQPWIKKKEVTEASCDEPTETRRKRRALQDLSGPDHELYSAMFHKFKSYYNKKYANEQEHRRRFRIFRANMKKVQMLQETEQGTAVYGATQFADLTAKEFKKHYLGFNPNTRKLTKPMKMAEIPDVKLPTEFDWRHYNVVTEVKNQGMCGSCWAFSVTGNIEGQWALHHNKLISLSEQELVDCDTLDEGCNGGLMDQAYHAIEKIGGLEDEQDYPYEGYHEKCHFNKSEVLVTLSGSVNISSNEEDMARWLFKNGPISIALNANAMQFYFGGVSHPWKVLCDPDDLDHGVLIVGFGVHRSSILHRMLPYWIVKNSWGPSWGEQGYYRIYRGDGTCGVNKMASSAIVN